MLRQHVKKAAFGVKSIYHILFILEGSHTQPMLTTDFQFDVNNYTNCNEQYPPNYQSQLSGEGIQIVVDHHDHMDQLQLQCK